MFSLNLRTKHVLALATLLLLSFLSVSADDKKTSKKSEPQAQAMDKSAADANNDEYKIGTEDELKISVWHENELSGPVVVRPDGMITMPLINDLPVVGLTTKQLQDLLTEKLKPFVTEPQVTVVVTGIRSRRVYLLGQVAHTGVFPLNGRRTILQLLAEAGGLGPYAKGDNIYVLRNQNGSTQRLNFNYKKALKDQDLSGDFVLMPGDTIVVP